MERAMSKTLHTGMNQRLHYKEIYQLAKERVNTYAETVKLPRLEA